MTDRLPTGLKDGQNSRTQMAPMLLADESSSPAQAEDQRGGSDRLVLSAERPLQGQSIKLPVGAAQHDSELRWRCGELHVMQRTLSRTIIRMNPESQSFWYRRVWWFPATGTVLVAPLIAATLNPSEQGVLLTLAILCSLPWAFALLLLDLNAGFADRSALIVCLGLCANVGLLWWLTALVRDRAMRRSWRQSSVLKA